MTFFDIFPQMVMKEIIQPKNYKLSKRIVHFLLLVNLLLTLLTINYYY